MIMKINRNYTISHPLKKGKKQMQAKFNCKVVSVSDRIVGTSQDGKSYDYRRVMLLIQDETVNFIIRNNASNAQILPKIASMKFGDEFIGILQFVKARDSAAYFCNLRGIE